MVHDANLVLRALAQSTRKGSHRLHSVWSLLDGRQVPLLSLSLGLEHDHAGRRASRALRVRCTVQIHDDGDGSIPSPTA